MARLIDADALKHEIVGAIPLMLSIRIPIEDEIDAAPTVDAIPMEWLNNKMLDLQNRDKALSKAAWLVLYEWQKAQEAR